MDLKEKTSYKSAMQICFVLAFYAYIAVFIGFVYGDICTSLMSFSLSICWSSMGGVLFWAYTRPVRVAGKISKEMNEQKLIDSDWNLDYE